MDCRGGTQRALTAVLASVRSPHPPEADPGADAHQDDQPAQDQQRNRRAAGDVGGLLVDEPEASARRAGRLAVMRSSARIAGTKNCRHCSAKSRTWD